MGLSSLQKEVVMLTRSSDYHGTQDFMIIKLKGLIVYLSKMNFVMITISRSSVYHGKRNCGYHVGGLH